jgi:preprotein translocase subunit Sec63
LQNPDPAAAKYFAEYISKAYAALTDEVSRLNYEKYGHPDGPQVRDLVAWNELPLIVTTGVHGICADR